MKSRQLIMVCSKQFFEQGPFPWDKSVEGPVATAEYLAPHCLIDGSALTAEVRPLFVVSRPRNLSRQFIFLYMPVQEDTSMEQKLCLGRRPAAVRVLQAGSVVKEVDVDVDRCKFYFNLAPGQCVRRRGTSCQSELVAVVLGIWRGDNGRLHLFFVPRGWKGGGMFPKPTELEPLDCTAPIPIVEIPPASRVERRVDLGSPDILELGSSRKKLRAERRSTPDIANNSPRRVVIPTLATKNLSNDGECNFSYFTKTGALLKLNTTALARCADPVSRLRHGKRFRIVGSEEELTFLGIAEFEGGVFCWFRNDFLSAAAKAEPGLELVALDGEVVIDPHSFTREFAYRPKDVDPAMAPAFDKMYSVGIGRNSVTAVDSNADRCRHYFDVIPGNRVNGCATVIGLKEECNDEGEATRVGLWVRLDDSVGAGVFEPQTMVFVQDEKPQSQVKYLAPSDILEVGSPRKKSSDIDLQCKFPFYRTAAVAGQATAVLSLFDVDPVRNAECFGAAAVPGARFGSWCTYIGMRVDDSNSSSGELKMFFSVDGQVGAVLFEVGTRLQRDETVCEVRTMNFGPLRDVRPVAEAMECPVDPTSLYWEFGAEPQLVRFDTRESICRHYFDVCPGDAFDAAGSRLIVIGVRKPAADNLVRLFLQPQNERSGCLTFEHGFLPRSTAPREVIPEVAVSPGVTNVPLRLPVEATTAENPIRIMPIAPEAELEPSFVVRARSGSVFKVDKQYAERGGFTHGQPFQVGSELLTFVGVGRETSDAPVRMWFRPSGAFRVVPIDAETTVLHFEKACLATVMEEEQRKGVIRKVSADSTTPPICTARFLLLLHGELKVTRGNRVDCVPVMGSSPKNVVLVDNDFDRCRHYFSLVPGVVVYTTQGGSNRATVVGMAVKEAADGAEIIGLAVMPDGVDAVQVLQENMLFDVSVEQRQLPEMTSCSATVLGRAEGSMPDV